MKAEDIKSVMALYRKLANISTSVEGFYLSLLLNSDKMMHRSILEKARRLLGPLDWIEAGLNCTKEEDVAPIAIADYFTSNEILTFEDLP